MNYLGIPYSSSYTQKNRGFVFISQTQSCPYALKHIMGVIVKIMKKRLYKKSDREKRAKEMTNTIRESRESGDGRCIAILKTGFTERTIYEYSKEFPFLKEEMSKFGKDKRFYK